MTISRVGSNTSSTTSVTIPSHQVGDLIIISAYRANNTAASQPSAGGTVPTWSAIQTTGANTVAIRTSYTIATATNHTSGTWTNATQMIVSVWRTDNANAILSIGQSANVGASATVITYPAITLTDPSGRSAIYRVGARNTALAAVATAPTNYDNFASTPGTPSIAAHQRLAQSANPTSQTVSMGGANNGVRGHTVEITETITGDAVVRNFAANERVQWGIGTGGMATLLQGAFTVAAVVKRVGFNTNDTQSWLAIEAASSSRGLFQATADAGFLNYLRGEFQSPGNGPSFPVGEGWVLVAVTKAAGTNVVRYHKCVFDTEVWTHSNSSGTVDNDPETATTLSTRHRNYANDNDYVWRGRYIVMAAWNSVLSDGAIEALRSGFQPWEDASPIWGVRFDQASTSDPINDWTGNGANQTALTGSSVITNEYIPGWEVDGDDFSGGSTAYVDVDTEGAGTPAFSGGSTATVDVITEANGGAAFSGGVDTEVDVLTEGAGSPSISGGSTAIVEILTEGAGQTQPNFAGGSTAIVDVLVQGAGSPIASGGSQAYVDVITFFNPDALLKVDVTIQVGPTRGGSVEVGNTQFGSVVVGQTLQERGP